MLNNRNRRIPDQRLNNEIDSAAQVPARSGGVVSNKYEIEQGTGDDTFATSEFMARLDMDKLMLSHHVPQREEYMEIDRSYGEIDIATREYKVPSTDGLFESRLVNSYPASWGEAEGKKIYIETTETFEY